MNKLFHYTGNKSKYLDVIIPKINEKSPKTVYDLFGGSGVIGFNCLVNGVAQHVVYNEVRPQVKEMVEYLVERCNPSQLDFLSERFPKTKESYLELRALYNADPRPELLYLLISRSFSNDTRFNKKGEFNLPYGDRNHFDLFSIIEHQKYAAGKVTYLSDDAFDLFDDVKPGDLVFVDPPYRITSATYNHGWGLKEDNRLHTELEKLTEKGAYWIYTNVFSNRGKVNQDLIDWVKRTNYKNTLLRGKFNYVNGKINESKSQETMIWNW